MERITSLVPRGPGDSAAHYGARRQSHRYPFHADVEVLQPVQAAGIALNVSTDGMRIALDHSVDVGSQCLARVVTAPGHETTEPARVVWARELPDGWLLGVAFERTH